ncbi:hypothetical protein AG0111_0g4069 [Alternaria gaisen]|uniref:Uncharacterized protein n=1 Tax=Alternaria gaisen TaxID=167740 RepID=A0ACB6FUA4_9PLEO|nr:hypothetical protein AG0111_0g4069 [Alternaria gaisen]
MGASHSTPPPLVEVNAPGGKVLVPPGTAFSVHPPSYARSRSDPYTRGPIYTPCPLPYRGGHQHQRPRTGPYPRYGGPHIDISEESDDSESTDLNVMESRSPRGMRRQVSKGYPGGMMGGGGMSGMKRRGGLRGFEGMDPRPRSAPETQMGGYPGMGGMPMGMPGSPKMGGMQPPGMPPEYTSNPPMPRLDAGAGINPYADREVAPSQSSSRSSPDTSQPTRRAGRKIPKHYEHIPKGAYANAEKHGRKSRSCADPQTSARLNRGQPWSKQVGPSGGELLGGDAFLDACICTTACNCRKSERVIYLARNDPHKGSDSDEEDYTYGSGEIRYILKTDLGKDCGDHSGCKKSESSDSEKEQKSKKKKKDKKEEKKRKDEFDEFKEDILEALNGLQDLKKDSHQRDRTESGPTRQPLGGAGIRPSAFSINDMDMSPRIAQQMGMMNGDPYGTGRMPPGMADPTGKWRMHPSMELGRMGGGMETTGLGGFENDMGDMGDMGMMGNPYMQPGMMNKKGMRPSFMSHRGAKADRQFSNGGMRMDMNMDQMAAMYGRAMGGGRGGMMMMGGGGGGGGRRAHLDSESDDFDLGLGPSMRLGMRQQAGRDRAGRGSRRPGNEDKDIPIRRDFGGSPLARANGSQDRGKQPRVDTDDDDAY